MVNITVHVRPLAAHASVESSGESDTATANLPSGKFAQKLRMEAADLLSRTTAQGYLTLTDDKHVLTGKGESAGVEFVTKGRCCRYFS